MLCAKDVESNDVRCSVKSQDSESKEEFSKDIVQGTCFTTSVVRQGLVQHGLVRQGIMRQGLVCQGIVCGLVNIFFVCYPSLMKSRCL